MAGPTLFDRVKNSRLVQVLILYLGASWVILEVAGELQEALALPAWVQPVAIILLLIGLVVVMATAWVQSHPTVDAREDAGEVPESWEVGLGDLAGAIRRGEIPHLTWARAIVGGIVALSLMFGFAGLLVLTKGRGPASDPIANVAGQPGAGLVVAPFAVSGVDEAVYGAGMVSLLAATLDGVPGIRAIDPRTVMARWAEVEAERGDLDLEGTLDVARRAGARYALVGSAVDAGAEVSLVGDLYGVEEARKLGTARGEGAPDSLMALVDRFSVEVARLLVSEGAGGLDLQHLESLTTSSLDALLDYIEGEEHLRQGSWIAAYDAYQRAVEADSTFALAHLRASQALGWRDGSDPRRGRHLAAAMLHSARLPARDRVLVELLDAVGTKDSLVFETAEEAVERYPDDPDLWNALGELHVHAGTALWGDSPRAREAFEQAVSLAPGLVQNLIHLTGIAIAAGDSADAESLLRMEQELASDETAGFVRGHEAAFAFRYGGPAARRASIEALETDAISWAVEALAGIENLSAAEDLLRAARDAYGAAARVDTRLASLVAHRGRVRESLTVMPESNWINARNRTILHHQGLLPASELPEPGWGPVWPDFGTAFTAVVRGDTATARRARDDFAATLVQEGAETWLLTFLDALLALEARRPRDAEPKLRELYAVAPVGDIFVAPYVLWIIGDAYERMGEEATAFRYFRAAGRQSPLAALRAARLADQLGDAEEARRLYQAVLVAWDGADPQFEPWMEEARGWLERVPG